MGEIKKIKVPLNALFGFEGAFQKTESKVLRELFEHIFIGDIHYSAYVVGK